MADNKTAKAFENLAPLLGLGASLAAQIPGLKKPKKRSRAESAARDTSMRAGAAAVGGAQTGFGASRGLALRTGLRQAANISRQGAAAAAQGEAADQARYDQQKNARNARLAQFGKDLGAATGQVALGVTQSRAAADAENADAERKKLEETAAQLLPSYSEAPSESSVATQPGHQALAGPNGEPQQLQAYPESGQGPTLDQLDEYGQDTTDPRYGMGEAPSLEDISMDPALAELGLQKKEVLYSIAPELELQHRLENLALDEAYRTGVNVHRVYARLRRLQNQPAISASILGMQQLQMPQGAQ